ncbi:hypothetical protein K438DRAFT_1582312 [Mycena galopus ATCC 62051]|nr:hypothetical protein K438DRAFT_1582312 [Mycena galopus ATCC 62051]
MFFPFTSLRKPTARPPILLWLVWVVLIVPCVLSGSVNRTIDDTFGDSVTGQLPTLGPNGWPDNFCGVFALLTSGCGTGNWAPNTADPDMFNHTYHFAYSDSNYLSLQFTGTT